MSTTKNAVKILPVIENSENKVVIYTEFESNFVIGDKLYIMCINTGSTEYSQLDSLAKSGYTNNIIGYELLGKTDNQLKIDIDYSGLTITGLTTDCYIGRIYVKSGVLMRGIINGSMLYDVNLNRPNRTSITWKQGIIVTATTGITNINFQSKYTPTELILKTVLNSNNDIESYYTKNNYNIGLTKVNLSNSRLSLNNCIATEGYFNNCDLTSDISSNISGGLLSGCTVGMNYIIDGGNLIDTTLTHINIQWLNGTWSNSWTGTTGNPFTCLIWNDGTWKNGIFPNSAAWVNGRFLNGTFKGQVWVDGTFNGGTFYNTVWKTGYFNNSPDNASSSIMKGSIWEDGVFSGGVISGTTWITGTFNGGQMSACTWTTGLLNDGIIANGTIWEDGTVKGGNLSNIIWNDGMVENGTVENSTWNDGDFHNGIFKSSTWNGGKFYNGTIFDSNWINGEMFFGTVNRLNWTGGTWHNGIANGINFYGGVWENGVFNYGTFYGNVWKNGSFNSGTFGTNTLNANWNNGMFYFGDFSGATWTNGTFYVGNRCNPIVPDKDYIGKPYLQYNKPGLMI